MDPVRLDRELFAHGHQLQCTHILLHILGHVCFDIWPDIRKDLTFHAVITYAAIYVIETVTDTPHGMLLQKAGAERDLIDPVSVEPLRICCLPKRLHGLFKRLHFLLW